MSQCDGWDSAYVGYISYIRELHICLNLTGGHLCERQNATDAEHELALGKSLKLVRGYLIFLAIVLINPAIGISKISWEGLG